MLENGSTLYVGSAPSFGGNEGQVERGRGGEGRGVESRAAATIIAVASQGRRVFVSLGLFLFSHILDYMEARQAGRQTGEQRF